MKVFKPGKLGILTRCAEANRQYLFSVSIMGFFPFGETKLLSDQDMWNFVPSELGSTVLDEGMSKRNAEVLVKGSAHNMGGECRPTCPVRVKVGEIDKSLYVIGDRHWKGNHQSEPQPFSEMPITWDRAYGGEGFEANPIGKGFAPVETEHGPIRFLPNVEFPGKLVTKPSETPSPAGFLPFELMWPQRFSKVGTYDLKWLKELFPGYAKDFDWGFFNVAPPDQQIEGFFRGDENLVIEGMHPREPRIQGQLPGVRGRCFITQNTPEGAEFLEIKTKLDTVWLFPHALRGVAIFHGMVPVREDDGADVDEIIIGAEWIDEEKSAEHYREVIAKRLDKESGSLNSLKDEDLLPTGAKWTAVVSDEDLALYQPELLIGKNLNRRHVREVEKARAEITEMGLDPDVYGPPMPDDTPEVNLANLAEFAQEKEKEAEQLRAEAEAKTAETMERMKQKHLDGGGTEEEFAELMKGPAGPPTYRAHEQLEGQRIAVADARANGIVLTELEEVIEDPDHIASLEQMEETLRDLYRQQAHIRAAVTRLQGPAAKHVQEAVIAARTEGESFERWDLTGADLSGLDLSGACFREAFLEKVDFSGANLTGADFTRAVLARCTLTEANLEDCCLEEASLGAADFRGIKFVNANLKGAILARSDLRTTSFRGCQLDEADFTEAVFGETDFTDAQASDLVFQENDLRGCKFTRAKIHDASFLQSDVSGVDFRGADLTSATFLEVTGDGALFTEAILVEASFVLGCSFNRCDFQAANLGDATFRETTLEGCNFNYAHLKETDFSETNLQKSTFYRAVGKEAMFIRADLRDAEMKAANLMEASLQKSDLRGTDFTGANLFASNFSKVHSDEATKLVDSNQKRVTIYPTRRK